MFVSRKPNTVHCPEKKIQEDSDNHPPPPAIRISNLLCFLLYRKAGSSRPRTPGGSSEKPELHSGTAETALMQPGGNTTPATNHVTPAGRNGVMLTVSLASKKPQKSLISHKRPRTATTAAPCVWPGSWEPNSTGKAPSLTPAFRSGLFVTFLQAAGKQQPQNPNKVQQFLSYSESVFWSRCMFCPSQGALPSL